MRKISTIIAAGLFTAAIAGQAVADNTRAYLPSGKALQGVQACIDLAKKNNWNMAIVVVDRGEDVIASYRMDEALPGAYTGATLKATTSLSWSMPTGKVLEFTKDNPHFNQFPGLLPIGGGEPIFSKSKKLIGAVGVAGGYVAHDEECARAVIKAISQ